MKYTYCVKDNYLLPCDKPKEGEEYYIFEYTRELQLIISKCIGNECKEVEPECLNLRFDLPEDAEVSKNLEKLSTLRLFMQKYNIKMYFIDDNSILEAVINPKLYYYKYLGIQDVEIRRKKIEELKKWTQRFLLFVNVLETFEIKKFLAHLDSLDGRYALWVKENSEEPTTIVETEKMSEVKVWLSYHDCDLFIKNKDQMCYKLESST